MSPVMENPIKAHIKASGQTQRELAEAMGVREATISAWSKKKIPQPHQMQRIAEITDGGVPVAKWFEWMQSMESET